MADIGQVCRRQVFSRFATPKSIKIVSDQVILSIDNGKTVKSYLAKSFSLNFRHPFDSRGYLKFRLGNLICKVVLLFLVVLACDNWEGIKPNRFCYYVQKGHGFRENLVSVIVSTFPIFMFVDQLLLVDVFSQLYYLTVAKKQQCRTYRYKSLRSWKIDNIDLTQQFDFSIFTNFRYQSIKITWLLSIFIDTDFYRLTTPGQ